MEVKDTSQPQSLEAEIVDIIEEKEIEVMGEKQLYQKLKLEVVNEEGKVLEIENGNVPMVNQQQYKKGDVVLLNATSDIDGNTIYFIADYIRRDALIGLLLIFLVITLLVAKKRAISSFIGLAVSFLIIFKFILPQIYQGANPIFIAIVSSIVIIPFTFYLSHGVNKKTAVAIIGTFVSLLVTGVLAGIFVSAAKLTGFASEEAGFLQVAMGDTVNIKGLLLAGIIVGALGILDDITVAQAAIVLQLKETEKKLGFKDLYQKAMKIGQDHIASMINTLILVYAGASLPLLLLFIDNPQPFAHVINHEIIATEVVKTLVGSIGLVIAVPVTTCIAAMVVENDNS
ncbi:MAG: YibE/F family protein [Patescibacteria group bacterium]|jgi:uncharacterized membrane protein